MLYDANGRIIAEQRLASARPKAGRFTWPDSSDTYTRDESEALTPDIVASILADANGGNLERQSKLAAEIEEKSWDIYQATQTRRMAVAGLPWSVEPEEDDERPRAKEIAEAAEQMLRAVRYDGAEELETFDQALRYSLQSALLPGFAVVELIWSKGGAEILGFQPIEQRHFTFSAPDGTTLERPLLRTTDNYAGIALPPGKFVYHRARARSSIAPRDGLIRPLAWLHCFSRINLGDLLTFIERYGMPFLVTQVGPDATAGETSKLKALVQAFGPAGGAVISDNVKTQLLQASSTTGDVYFRLLEYCGDAATKVILGQLATSSEGGGLSKDGQQGKVRQDLIEADARSLESTTQKQILRPWAVWNYGPDAPIPRLHLHSEAPEDTAATAKTAADLYSAGLEWDEEEASERMGMKLTRKAPAPPPPGLGAPRPPRAGEPAKATPPTAKAEEPEPEDDAAAMAAETAKIPVRDLAIPPTWDAPVRDFLAELERRTADSSVADADLLAWLEEQVSAMPKLLDVMDVTGLAKSLRAGMTDALYGTVRETATA